MNETPCAGSRSLAPAVLAGILPWLAGALLLWGAARALDEARRELSAARTDLAQQRSRLAAAAQEQGELREALALYRELRAARVIGAERRLDWAEALERIRAERDLAGLRYRIEPRVLLRSMPGRPAPVEFHASSMHVQFALLHEGDLLRFLHDLRRSGNAHHAPRHCRVQRAAADDNRHGVAPRLEADCRIDLITIVERGATS